MELRYTDTNAADDSTGRAFGMEGNLYFPVLIGLIAAIATAGLLVLMANASLGVAAMVGGIPLIAATLWVVGLRHGRPSGYDRDWLEQVLARGDFSRKRQDGEGLV
jgi:hypothetical protein